MDVRNRHITIENVQPSVDGGKYPVKKIVGEVCVVSADVFRDGHDPLVVQLCWRHEQDPTWSETFMSDDGNDGWTANFRVEKVGRYQFSVRAWSDAGGKRVDEEKLAAPYEIVVDEPVARFGAWYEMFVRSQGTEPGKSGTFRDAEKRLSDIKAMGFDVVYLPPIHPIGRTARKGPNDSLNVGSNDPGSPWAIGNENGGHTAIEPAIGTLQDFDRFVAAAQSMSISVAIDFAPHCSPDHPWVTEHPEWFYHRPDGSIQCAENPPYRYDDIYPLNFDCDEHEKLYDALLHVFLFWIGHGVRIFRVDNPHTKPVVFWEWVIREVKRRTPETIFLAEAFTRPKMMKMLSKAGFSQSYTYFIWRNSKRELAEYIEELADPKMSCYFRPNFFVTTPDVLPPYLQNADAAVFKSRLALAALLSPTYGIVNGYELVENVGLPGKQEYADSEKFEIKVRDWNKAGNIKQTVSMLNRIRRENVALQLMENVTVLPSSGNEVLVALKTAPDRSNTLIVAVSLDPHAVRETSFEIPMDKIGFSWEAQFEVHELVSGSTVTWTKNVHLRMDPSTEPFQIFRIKR